MNMQTVDYSNKRVFKNSAMSFVYKAISMILSFVSTPLLLSCLGEEKNGILVTIGSFLSWIYYSDLGIGSGLRNKVAVSLGKKDITAVKGYIRAAYIVVSIISAVFFLVVLVVVVLFDVSSLFHLYLSDENIKLCIIVAFFFSCVNFVLSLVNNIAYAEQRASLVSFFNLLGQTFNVITIYIFYKTGISLILFLFIAEGVAQIIKNIIETIYVFTKYPDIIPKDTKYNKIYAKGMLSFGLMVFISQLSSLIHNSTDNILITYLFGAADVTPYDICYKYFNMINSFYIILITPVVSAYTVANAEGNKKWIKNTMRNSMLLFLVFFIGTIVACFIFRPFAFWWLKKSLEYGRDLLPLTAVYFVLMMFSHNTSSLQTGLGDMKMATVAVAISAIVNIPASVFFAKYCGMGIAGIMAGSVVSMFSIVIVGIYKFIYYSRKMK